MLNSIDLVKEICMAEGLPLHHLRLPLLLQHALTPWSVHADLLSRVFFHCKNNDCTSSALPEAKLAANLAVLCCEVPFDFELWTDGSADLTAKQSAGAAILYSSTARLSHKIVAGGPIACSYRVECEALRIGLELLPRLEFNEHRTCRVVTDSQSLLMALEKGPLSQTSYSEDQIWLRINELVFHGWSLTFQFVFSHCGLPRNDEVDQLAKEAAATLHQRQVAIWIVDFMTAAKRHLLSAWRENIRGDTERFRLVGNTSSNLRASEQWPRKIQVLAAQSRTSSCTIFGLFPRLIGLVPKDAPCRWCHPNIGPPLPLPPPEPPPAPARTNRVPQQCPHCKKMLSCMTTLTKHIARYHATAPAIKIVHTCSYCGKEYKNATSRRTHEIHCRKLPRAKVPHHAPLLDSTCPYCRRACFNLRGCRVHMSCCPLRPHNAPPPVVPPPINNPESLRHLLLECDKGKELWAQVSNGQQVERVSEVVWSKEFAEWIELLGTNP